MIPILFIFLALFFGVSSVIGESWPPDKETFTCSSRQADCELEAETSTEPSEAHVGESLVIDSLMEEDEGGTLEGFMKDEAQYRDAENMARFGEELEAYESFKELASMGKTNFWVYMAHYRAGAVAIGLGEPESAVEAHLVSAFELRPTRAEPLLLLAQYFARQENYAKAFLYAEAGRDIPHPEDSAFQEGDKYTGLSERSHYAFGFLHEICSVSSHHIGNYEVGKGACEELLTAHELGMLVPDDIVEETKESLHFYKSKVGAVKPPTSVRPSMDSVALDKAYLINLDRRPERLERMDSILNRLGLCYERLRGVDGALEVTEEYMEHHKIRPLTAYEALRTRNVGVDMSMSRGEIGCFMSHYNIWLDIVKNQYNQSLVLEDDVSFSPDFSTMLPFVLSEAEQLGDEWDVILLAKKKIQHHGSNKDEEVEGSNCLLRPSFSVWALAYLVSARGAAKLVGGEPLSKLVAADDYFFLMSGSFLNQSDVKELLDAFPSNQTFNLLSARPSLAWATHWIGIEGYVSDTRPVD